MNLTIYGRIPSKKNSVIISTRYGRVMRFPSHGYQDWHIQASGQLSKMDFANEKDLPFKKCSVRIKIFAPDKRSADLTNKAESIMDLLVDNKIIADDNWFVVPGVHLLFGGVDKNEPRAEIEISSDDMVRTI